MNVHLPSARVASPANSKVAISPITLRLPLLTVPGTSAPAALTVHACPGRTVAVSPLTSSRRRHLGWTLNARSESVPFSTVCSPISCVLMGTLNPAQLAINIPLATVQVSRNRSTSVDDPRLALLPPQLASASTIIAPASLRVIMPCSLGAAPVIARASILVDGGEGALQGVLFRLGGADRRRRAAVAGRGAGGGWAAGGKG